MTTLTTSTQLLTVKQVAQILDVHPATIYRWIAEGALPAFSKGRVTRIRTEHLENFLETNPWRD